MSYVASSTSSNRPSNNPVPLHTVRDKATYLRVCRSYALWAINPVPLLPGDELLLQWLVFSHSARNQCHGGNKGIECQIAGVSGSTKPFWSTARSLLGGWGNGWRVEEGGITGQQGQATQFLIPSENIALCQETCNSMLPFLLYWEKKMQRMQK